MEGVVDTKEHVLYVDDIKANLLLFEATFDSDFKVALAESGEEALKLLEEKEFAVVVSDQNMPGMTGTELLEIVAQKYPEIMRFMITAYTDYATVVDSINKGQVYGYFNKPYNSDEVRNTINNSLEVRRLRIKNQEMILKLERANEELIEIEKTKINFLNGLTSELRVPINKIMTAVHMIKDRVDSRELTESLHFLDQSMGRLESFSESAKLLVRLHDNTGIIKQESISLKELVEVGIIEKRENLKIPGLTFKVEDQSEGKKGIGEFDLLLPCFLILMDLVIEHAAEQSEIVFSIQGSDNEISLGIISKKCSYIEKERSLLVDLFAEKITNFNKDYKMELILAHHIIFSHRGRIQLFFEEDETSQIIMTIPASVS